MREFAAIVGQQLLVKSGRGVVLTEAGQQLAVRIPAAFEGLDALAADITGKGMQSLHLAVCSAFGPSWLIPRLARFRSMAPGIDVRLKLYARDPLINNEVSDAIVTTYPLRDGYDSVRLMSEHAVAVCREDVKADVLNGRKIPFITTDPNENGSGEDWISYAKAAKLAIKGLRDSPFVQCSHHLLALELARNGCGIALVPDFMVKADIDAQRLSLLSNVRYKTGKHYDLRFRKNRSKDASILTLKHWLVAECKGVSA
jgi:DNA-binding transcriptional LysR family regulator